MWDSLAQFTPWHLAHCTSQLPKNVEFIFFLVFNLMLVVFLMCSIQSHAALHDQPVLNIYSRKYSQCAMGELPLYTIKFEVIQIIHQ